ncbi:SRPBCC domain-containing protein [Paenibacillus sp. OV219]|uniref:SRPBCC family protein n=1 Tax=Paenibacillus sp. OV219 TaxID=1884377 RepID=UPI0008CD306F|nr:SRPBCC domain-containing protein [Paenibacillus sp. OV219]SEM67129.1 Uncharacterized conserved protein YndB, AHSA1/START domain [Paenibacillus sp. OV219]
MADHQTTTGENINELLITRVLDAPRELVFKVFTQAEHLKHWWGPAGLEMGECKVDLEQGGLFHYSMKTPDGQEMWGKFEYREIDEPNRLVYITSFSDKEGNSHRHPMAPTWPIEVWNELVFEEQEGGKTLLIMRGKPFNASDDEIKTFNESHHLVQGGFAGTLAQLDAYLAALV